MASFSIRCVLLVTVLCLCCQIIDGKKPYQQRRRDVHRIVLKSKNKGSRLKKPIRPHYHQYQEESDPYLDHSPEPSHHHDAFEESPYSSHQYNRFRDADRYKDDRYKERHHYHGYKPYKHHDYEPTTHKQHYHNHQQQQQQQQQQHDFDPMPYKQHHHLGPAVAGPGGADYTHYREMMDEYNRKQEEEFRRQVEKSRLQMQYHNHNMQKAVQYQQQQQQQSQQQQQQQTVHQLQQQQQAVQQPVQEAYHFAETQHHGVWNTANDFRGDWSPISQSETVYNPANSFANNAIPAYESTPTTTPSQSPQYAQYSLEITTAKPQKPPPIIIEKNATKGHRHKTSSVNYNFGHQYFPNHRPVNNQHEGNNQYEGNNRYAAGNSYDVKEANVENSDAPISYQNQAIVSGSYSTIWANPSNETMVNEGQMGGKGHFGTRTKVRRTKRPAYAAQ